MATAPKKTTTRGRQAAARAAQVEEKTELVGRFWDLQQEAAGKRRGPYVLTADVSIPPLTLDQVWAFRKEPDPDKKLELLLGDHHEAVLALFGPEDPNLWNAFQNDLYAHFFGQGAEDVPGGSTGS